MSDELAIPEQARADETPWQRWWRALQERRGDRASLRRCRSVLDVALEPAFHDLLKRLGSRLKEVDRDRVAAVAAILAHVEKDEPAWSIAELMARPKGDKPVVSDARFRRLLRLESPDELMHELVRVIGMLGGEAPVAPLASDLARWGDPIRKRWALAYYEKAEPLLQSTR